MTRPSGKQPCPCGSGKPFRKCCGRTLSPAQRAIGRRAPPPRWIKLPDGAVLSPDQAMQEAMNLHRAGRFLRAAERYRQVLTVVPEHADALHLLGVTERQVGRPQEAVRLICRALELQPDTPLYLNNLADAYLASGDPAQSEGAARRAIAQQPDLAEAHYNLGAALRQQGAVEAAISAFRSALALRPDYQDAQLGIGDTLVAADRHDEALAAYGAMRESTAASVALNTRIGIALRRAGRLEEAIGHYRDCIARAPSAEYHNNLALLYLQLEQKDAAADQLRQLLALTPANTSARHLLSALEGKTTDRAPADYVRELFDQYAESFESHLVNKLAYRTPQLLGDIIRSHMQVERLDILDLGCGTGLMVEVLADIRGRSVGIDISPKMVEVAKRKGIYTEVHAEDIVGYMQRVAPGGFDLIVAADVFVYIGDLRPLFREAVRLLRPGGWFAFTVEAAAPEESGYVLDHTGRYRHADTYLHQLAGESGFTTAHFSEAVIRTQSDRPVNGYLCLLSRPV